MIINDVMPIAEFSFVSIEPVARQQTINNRDIVTKQSSQKWQFTITTPNMTQNEFLASGSFMARQANGYGEFQLKLPMDNIYGDNSNATVSASCVVGDDEIAISGHGVIASGTFIKFSGHSKIYQVATSTTTQITVYPPLVSAVSSSESIVIDQPIATVRMISDMPVVKFGADNIGQKFDLTLVEVI